MNINLANIDFCPVEGGGTPSEVKLAPTTAEILLTETEKVILPPSGIDGFNKVTITHAPVEESVSATITSNGTHTITPSEGFGAMFGVNVDVNVPSKTEVAKNIVITENGNTTYTPNEGEVFNSVSVDVNVPIKEETTKEVTITSNGLTTITPPAEKTLSKVDVNVNVPSKTEVAKDITITQNGNTTYTPNEGEVFNSVSVDVNVPASGDNLDTSNIIGTASWWNANKDRYCGLSRDTDADPNYEVPNSLRGGICSQVPYTGELVALKSNGDTGVPMKTWNDSWENVNNKNGQVYINHLCDLDISSDSQTYSQPEPYVILNNITGKREIVGVDAYDYVDYTYNYDESTSETARYSKGYPIECIEVDDYMGSYGKYLNYLNKPFVIRLYSQLAWNNSSLNELISGRTLPDVVLLYNDTDIVANPGALRGFEITDYYRFTGSTTILYPSWKEINDVNYVSCSNTPGLSSIPNWIEEIHNVTNTSSAKNMSYAFSFCKALKKLPLFDVSNVTSAEGMFYFCENLREIPEGMTFPKLVKTGGQYGMFERSGITHIPEGMIPGKLVDATKMFSECSNLTEISKLDLSEITQNKAFEIVTNCKSLTTLGGFTGLKVDLTLSTCPNLTKESLLNVFNEAADVTASPKTLTLGATNLAKLTDDEKVIATNKGWTLQ